MRYSNIDEIIKKSLGESTSRNEFQMLQSKSKVWESISLPKNRKTIHWGFVASWAASLSLAVLCTFLFLKLESQQTELAHVKINLKEAKAAVDKEVTIISMEPDPELEELSIPVSEPIRTEQIAILPGKEPDLAESVEETIGEAPFPDSFMENEVIDVRPDIKMPEFHLHVQEVGLILPQQAQEETFTSHKPKTQRKLTFRIGNSNSAYDQQNSFALNIKL